MEFEIINPMSAEEEQSWNKENSSLISLAYYWTGLPEGPNGKGKTDKLVKHTFILLYQFIFDYLERNIPNLLSREKKYEYIRNRN